MSKFSKAFIVGLGIFCVWAVLLITHHEGWKKGFQEGWCHAQPKHTRC